MVCIYLEQIKYTHSRLAVRSIPPTVPLSPPIPSLKICINPTSTARKVRIFCQKNLKKLKISKGRRSRAVSFRSQIVVEEWSVQQTGANKTNLTHISAGDDSGQTGKQEDGDGGPQPMKYLADYWCCCKQNPGMLSCCETPRPAAATTRTRRDRSEQRRGVTWRGNCWWELLQRLLPRVTEVLARRTRSLGNGGR